MSGHQPLALVSPGQGSQRPGGVVDLPEQSRPWFDRASDVVGVDLWEAGLTWDQEALGRPSILQPFLVAWGVADFEWSRAAGTIDPAQVGLVLGHSSGQNTALVLSGALDFESGVHFAHERGRHLDLGCEAAPGALVALAGVDAALCEQMAAATGMQLANYNAPDQFVLGGPRRAAQRAIAWAEQRELAAVLLRVNGAFHTELFRHSDELSEPLIDALPLADHFTPLIGNASGQLIAGPQELRRELRLQYTRPIQWVAAMETAYARGARTFAVTGPGNAMAGLVRRFGKTTSERLRVVRLHARRP